MSEPPIANTVPPSPEVEERIGFLLRELKLARQLLRLAKIADRSRRLNADMCEVQVAGREVAHAAAR